MLKNEQLMFPDVESDKENQQTKDNKATPVGQKASGLLGRKRSFKQRTDTEQKETPAGGSLVTDNARKWKEVSLVDVHGIAQEELDGAPSVDRVRLEVQKILREMDGVILVGHSLNNDLLALGLPTPTTYIDTSNLRFLSTSNGRPQSLVNLLKNHLNLSIRQQSQENTTQTPTYATSRTSEAHSSLEDAAATMKLFLSFQNHPEGVVADSTAKTFDYKVEVEKRDRERKDKLKKREKKDRKDKDKEKDGARQVGKKIHRKDFDEKVMEIAEKANKSQKLEPNTKNEPV